MARVYEQAEIDGELGAVVRGVQDAAPEDPDALAAHFKEGGNLEPPGFRLDREELEALEG